MYILELIFTGEHQLTQPRNESFVNFCLLTQKNIVSRCRSIARNVPQQFVTFP